MMRCCYMNAPERDLSIIKHILSYCDQINMAVERFGKDYNIFETDPIYRNAVALCILQIGELVGNLSDGFKEDHTQIPWRQIKLMRNIVAHRYGAVDNTITWDVIENDIPKLKAYCELVLRST